VTDVLYADTCACGDVVGHHKMVDRIVWCRMCGSARIVGQTQWMIPLTRAGDFPNSRAPGPPDPPERDEPATSPGTPGAKKSSDRIKKPQS